MNLQNSAEEIINQGEHDWKLIKYLERVTAQGTYFGLGSHPFCSNWAVHGDLDQGHWTEFENGKVILI